MSIQHVELELDVNQSAVRGQALWNTEQTSNTDRQTGTRTLNARVVEFISKPGKIQSLENCVRGPIMEFLNGQDGFRGAIILSSHQERRLIQVVSLWTTQRMAAENCWERSRVVRQATSSLIDVRSRVHTYEAVFAISSELKHENSDRQVIWPEVHE